MTENKKINKRKHLIIYMLIAVILLTLGVVATVSARYYYKEGSNGSIQSNEFYFSSDLLDGGTHTLAPGSTSVSFSVGNHADELRYSQVDIEYEVKLNGSTPTGSNLTGTLIAGSVKDQKVTITGLTPGQSYEITAKGIGGYHKTIRATIVIPLEEANLYKYLDTSNPGYVLLTVWSKGVQGNVTITPPDSIIPDNTDDVMNGVVTGSTITDTTSFSATGYGSHVYRFFGSGVTVDDFTVKSGTIIAETKAPN